MIPQINPSVMINPSNRLREILTQLRGEIENVPVYTENDELLLKDVRWIYDNRKMLPLSFHELIAECDVILPSPVFPARSPVLEARIQRYKAEEANREYQSMVSNISVGKHSSGVKEETFAQQMKEVNRQLIVIFQFIVSVVTSFVFGYSAPYYLYGSTDTGFRLILGLFFGFVVAVADLYFVMKYMLETDGVIERPSKKDD